MRPMLRLEYKQKSCLILVGYLLRVTLHRKRRTKRSAILDDYLFPSPYPNIPVIYIRGYLPSKPVCQDLAKNGKKTSKLP